MILFTPTAGTLHRVSAGGGAPEPILDLREQEGEGNQVFPFFLPDGQHFIYTSATAGSRARGIYLASLGSKETRRLVSEATGNAVYAQGYLLYLRDTTLMAHAFDPERLALGGAAVPIAENIQVNSVTGSGAFAVSQRGELVYQTGGVIGTQLVWVDRTGKRLGALGERAAYGDIRLSADGSRVSVTVLPGAAALPDIWVFGLNRATRSRFTFGPNGNVAGLWSPDGSRVAFAAQRKGPMDMYMKPATGAGREEVLLARRSSSSPVRP